MMDKTDYQHFLLDNFTKIIGTHFVPGSGRVLIIVEVPEEELVFLRLKFGPNNVWKR
jgi:hypothetical protein